jgi:hypothetical protein
MAAALALGLAAVGAGCAGDEGRVKRVEVEVLTKSQAASRGAGGKPEPVYSTSFAIRLAELALKEAGAMDCHRRDVTVSYCDGIYTVTFERPPAKVMAKDYRVAIEADTSRILQLDLGR